MEEENIIVESEELVKPIVVKKKRKPATEKQ